MTRRQLNAKIKKHKFKVYFAALIGAVASYELFSYLPFEPALQDIVLTGIAFNLYLVCAITATWAALHIVKACAR